jgi:hypothetical protein
MFVSWIKSLSSSGIILQKVPESFKTIVQPQILRISPLRRCTLPDFAHTEIFDAIARMIIIYHSRLVAVEIDSDIITTIFSYNSGFTVSDNTPADTCRDTVIL